MYVYMTVIQLLGVESKVSGVHAHIYVHVCTFIPVYIHIYIYISVMKLLAVESNVSAVYAHKYAYTYTFIPVYIQCVHTYI